MPYHSGPIHWVGSTMPPRPETLEWVDVEEQAAALITARRGVYLFGPSGRGKSTLLAEYVREEVDRPLPHVTPRLRHHWLDRTAIWTQASEYVEDCRAEIGYSQRNDFSDWSDEFSASGIARRVPLLIIDDLGTESDTPYSRERIESLIDARYRLRDKTVTHVTSNLSLRQIVERYSARTASRLAEMTEPIPVGGADRRMERFA